MPILYIPRDERKLKVSEGGTVAFEQLPTILQQPLRIYNSGDINGLASGYRSALISYEGHMYKIKGVRPHRRLRNKNSPDPLGGQYLSRVELETENMQAIAELFVKEGISYPCKPLGYYKYPLEFNGEQLAAGIFEIQGDTRVDELVDWLEEDIREERGTTDTLCTVLLGIGMKMGKLKKILDENGYCWGEGSAHMGNFVVFARDGYIHIGIVDLDSTLRVGEEATELQEMENNILINDIRAMNVSSRSRNRIRLSRKRSSTLWNHPTYNRGFIESGFNLGYRFQSDTPLPEGIIYEAKKVANKEDLEYKNWVTFNLELNMGDEQEKVGYWTIEAILEIAAELTPPRK